MPMIYLRRFWRRAFPGKRIFISPFIFIHTFNLEKKKTISLVSSSPGEINWQFEQSEAMINLLLSMFKAAFQSENQSINLKLDRVECVINNSNGEVKAHFYPQSSYGLGLARDTVTVNRAMVDRAIAELAGIKSQHRERNMADSDLKVSTNEPDKTTNP